MSRILQLIREYKITEVAQIQKIMFWVSLTLFSIFWVFYFIFVS